MINTINKVRLVNLLEYGLQHDIILNQVLKGDLEFVYDISHTQHHLTLATKDKRVTMSIHIKGMFKPTYKVIRYVNEPVVRYFEDKGELMRFILRKVSQ